MGLVACGGDGTLVVQVRTDLLPVTDFASVELVVTASAGSLERTFERAAREDRAWGAGVRLGETTLPPGSYRARVVLVAASGDTIMERPLSFELRNGELRVITVLLTRDCEGVECPLAGDDASQAACLAGRCVDAGCSEETPELCGEPECSSAAECAAAPIASCAATECTASGACVEILDHASCMDPGSVCSAAAGCVPESGGPLSAPGPGHVHLVAAGPGFHLHRLELRAGAAAQDVSSLFDADFPNNDATQNDTSAALSPNGEWMTLVGRRSGCSDCLLVTPVRDVTRGELIEGVTPDRYRGTDITDDGRRIVFVQDISGDLRVLSREADGWVVSPEPLTTGTTYPFIDEPSFSFDGERVLFACGSGLDALDAGICEAAVDGSGVRELVAPGANPGMRVEYPQELPDGGVLFQRQPDLATTSEVLRLPPGSASPVAAFPSTRDDLIEPCVLPDGRVVLIAPDGVHVISADGASDLRLTLELPPERWIVFVDSCGL
jgi:hypothetical protein